jgi:hypothetical protein
MNSHLLIFYTHILPEGGEGRQAVIFQRDADSRAIDDIPPGMGPANSDLKLPTARLTVHRFLKKEVRSSRRVALWYGNTGDERKMVGGVILFASHRDDLCVLDPDRRGDEDIIDLETEEKSPEPVERSRVTIIWMAHPEGVHERIGIQHSSRYFGSQMDLPFQILYRRAFFPGIEIARQDEGVRMRPRFDALGQKDHAFLPRTERNMIQMGVVEIERLLRVFFNQPRPTAGAPDDVSPSLRSRDIGGIG